MKKIDFLRLFVPVAIMGAACSSIIGVEDLNPDPRPGTGDGGDNGTGGTGAGKGGASGASSGTAGNAGNAGNAGKGGASGAAGSTGTGGTAGDAGGGGEETGGTSGSGGAPDGTVRGKLVTTWLQPIPNVTVMIGDAEADTNAMGEFEIPDVAESYDVKFVLNYTVNNATRTYGWAYLGLTRRDPTLSVYNGLTARDANLAVEPLMPTGTNFSNRKLIASLGGPDGARTYEVSLPNGIGQTGTSWQGPAMTNVTAHGLLFEYDANELPSVYRSYDEGNEVLTENQTTSVQLTVPDENVGAGAIAGTVTSPTSADRTNFVYLRFQSNAFMQLVEHYGTTLTPGTFSYSVPTIPGASVEVVAVEGTWSFGPAALAHRDGLTPGDMNVALVIPTPPQQVAPASDVMGVNGSTIFSWTSSASTFVWTAENIEPTSPYGGLFVVTAEKRVSIPEFPNGYTLLPGDLYNWRVETHGSAATVNALAGDDGFADAYGPYAESPESPRRGDGTYAISGGRVFTTAP